MKQTERATEPLDEGKEADNFKIYAGGPVARNNNRGRLALLRKSHKVYRLCRYGVPAMICANPLQGL